MLKRRKKCRHTGCTDIRSKETVYCEKHNADEYKDIRRVLWKNKLKKVSKKAKEKIVRECRDESCKEMAYNGKFYCDFHNTKEEINKRKNKSGRKSYQDQKLIKILRDPVQANPEIKPEQRGAWDELVKMSNALANLDKKYL